MSPRSSRRGAVTIDATRSFRPRGFSRARCFSRPGGLSRLGSGAAFVLFLALAGTACSEEASLRPSPPPTPAARAAGAQTPEPEGGRPLVLFLGDSLTAGYGLPEDEAFPAVLGRLLTGEGRAVRVVNAGVSGDTTAGGLRRLPWLLRQRPAVLVIGLGGNDALRGLPAEQAAANLRAAVEGGQRAGARVLLLGMRVPPNLGADYAARFEAIYPEVARETGAPLVPFFLEGVGGIAAMNQADGIHPTARGHDRIAETLLPYLEDLLPVA